jgi:Kdo2-lipid IVA lauroyltransferase/acyltransferase
MARRPPGAEAGPLWMRATAALAALLPYAWLRPLGSLLGALVGSLLRIRRRHVEEGLARAGIAPAAAIARGVYASLGTGLLELLWLAGRPPGALGDRFEMDPACARALADAAAQGRGVVVATAHTGNWDLSACAAAHWFAAQPEAHLARAKLSVVTKRLSWRALDRYWQRLRADRGVGLIDAEGAAARVRAALAAGGIAVLLVDQAPERASGVATLPFLGAPALHDLGPLLIAARARAPLLFILGHRAPDGRHRLELALAIDPADLRAGRASLEAGAARIAAALERFVRAHPEQWLWLHRRWKGAAATAPRRAAPPGTARPPRPTEAHP